MQPGGLGLRIKGEVMWPPMRSGRWEHQVGKEGHMNVMVVDVDHGKGGCIVHTIVLMSLISH